MDNARETAFSGEDLDVDIVGGDESTKSERKRQRERQRRSDLASAFDELASILSLIDPDESSDSLSTRQKRRKKSVGDAADLDANESAGSTRLHLIGKSVDVLRRLHNENVELKRIHERNNGEEKDDDKVSERYISNNNQTFRIIIVIVFDSHGALQEVFVMVPTLTQVDNDHGEDLPDSPSDAVARASGPYPHQSYYTHHSTSLGPAPYHQGPPPPEYRGYYSSPPMHRNYAASYQHGANWLGGGGGYYQPPLPVGQYSSPPQQYETSQPSASVHSQSNTG